MTEVQQLALFDYTDLDAETGTFVRERTDRIRARGRRIVADVLGIGEDLTAVKAKLGHGQWLGWLKLEFAWSDQTALNFMYVHAVFGKSQTIWNLEPIDLRALYLLAAPRTPEPAREAALELAAEDQPVKHAQVKAAVGAAKQAAAEGKPPEAQKAAARTAARLPTPTQARKLAAESGTYVAASDGRLYTGKPIEQERAEIAHTERIFAYVNPIRDLAEAAQEPEDWLNELPPYMRKLVNTHLARAHDRLNRLMELWTYDDQSEMVDGDSDRDGRASSRAAGEERAAFVAEHADELRRLLGGPRS